MNESLPLWLALAASVASGAIIFLERLFPFALFSRREPPAFIRFIERYIPSLIIAVLVVYSLKDVRLGEAPFGLPQVAGVAAAAALQLLFKNPMVSIFGSTALCMVLQRLC